MKYDVKCYNLGCDAHYEHDDCGSETPPSRCAYCGSTKVNVSEIDEEAVAAEDAKEMNRGDEPGEIPSSTIKKVIGIVGSGASVRDLKLTLAAISAMLPEEEVEEKVKELHYLNIKNVGTFLNELHETTEKFALANFEPWANSLNQYIYCDGNDFKNVLDIIQSTGDRPDEFDDLFEAVRNKVYDSIEN